MPSEDSRTKRAINLLISLATKGVYAPNSTSRSDADLVLCGRCFNAAARPIFALMPGSEVSVDFWKRQMRTNHPEFWVDLAAFVTQPRDSGAYVPLVMRLLEIETACNLATHDVSPLPQDRAVHGLTSLLPDFMGSICTAFLVCFHETSGLPLDVAVRFSAKGAFPRSQEDLIPRGASETIHGILSLWEFGSNGSDFIVLAWLTICWRKLCPLLQQERTRFIKIFVERVNHLIDLLEHLPHTADAENGISHLVRLWAFTQRDVVWARQFFVDHHRQLGVLIDNVHRITPLLRGNVSPVLTQLASCAAFHERWMSAPAAESGALDSDGHPIARTMQPVSTGDPFTNFHWMFKLMRRQLDCDRRGCSDYGRLGHTSLQRCARCMVARYCSRECQRTEWKEVVFPHKEVCPIYRAIPRADVQCDVFARECREKGTSVDQLAIAAYHLANTCIRDEPIAAHADFHIQGSSFFLRVSCIKSDSNSQ